MWIEITLPILGAFSMPMILFTVLFLAIPATLGVMFCVWLDSKPEKAGN